MQLLERNAAAADDKANLVCPAQRQLPAQRSAHADGGRRLTQQLALQKQQLHAAEDIIIRHGRKAVGVRRHIREAHISKLENHRVEKVEDVLNVGDMTWVKVTEIDEKGRVNLSRKDALKELAAQDK